MTARLVGGWHWPLLTLVAIALVFASCDDDGDGSPVGYPVPAYRSLMRFE